MRDVLRAEAKAMHSELTARFETRFDRLTAETNARFDRLTALIERNHETTMRMLADHDQRVAKLEGARP